MPSALGLYLLLLLQPLLLLLLQIERHTAQDAADVHHCVGDAVFLSGSPKPFKRGPLGGGRTRFCSHKQHESLSASSRM